MAESNSADNGNAVGSGQQGAIRQETYGDNYLNEPNPVGGSHSGRGHGVGQAGNNPVGGRR